MTEAPWTLAELEAALVEESRREGLKVIEHDGSWFGRIEITTTCGEHAVSDINLTRLAQAMERRLS